MKALRFAAGMSKTHAVVCAAGLWPFASTAEVFAIPAGCSAYLTVQSKSCTVTHHFRCADDPEGHQRRVDIAAEGIVYQGVIDRQAQWILADHASSGHRERLEELPLDRASLSELFATGVDSFDFVTHSDEIGATRYSGFDRLTGRRVEIGGVILEETAFELFARDEAGGEVWRASGKEYVSREWRMFIAGRRDVEMGGSTWSVDTSPVDFIFPGEAGFLSTTPYHGCSVVMS